jgi:hypothetical protein
MAANVPSLKFLLVFLLVCALGMIQMPSPECEPSAQPVEIKIGKRPVRAVEIPHGTLENRARTHMVAFRLVMKSNGQLNHTLEVPAQGTMTGRLTPGVFEDFVGVEEAGGVEEGEAT